jgi:tRNA nucleotidyltransferase (CCA-adding enzyme)
LTFFYPNKIKPWSINKIIDKIDNKKFIGLRIKKPSVISENLYPQIRKAVRSIEQICQQNDFTINFSDFIIDKYFIYMIFSPENLIISDNKIHIGPPIKMEKNAKEFKKRWQKNNKTKKGPFEENGRLFVEIAREYTNIHKFLNDKIPTLSLGKHIDKVVQEEFIILKKKDLLIDSLREYWTKLLDEKMSWER